MMGAPGPENFGSKRLRDVHDLEQAAAALGGTLRCCIDGRWGRLNAGSGALRFTPRNGHDFLLSDLSSMRVFVPGFEENGHG